MDIDQVKWILNLYGNWERDFSFAINYASVNIKASVIFLFSRVRVYVGLRITF